MYKIIKARTNDLQIIRDKGRINNAAMHYLIIDEDETIGIISLTDIDFVNRTASVGLLMIDNRELNICAAGFALKSILHHAFICMKLNRLETSIATEDEATVGLFENAGFVREGVRRQSVIIENTFSDTFLYSLLKKDYYGLFGQKDQIADLPAFCIDKAVTAEEKRSAILACDSAFGENSNVTEKLLEKICISADVLVALDDRILGYCAAYANNYVSKEGYITLIAVRPEAQNQGIGRALVEAFKELCVDRGINTIRLEVRKDNLKAIDFYSSLGFYRGENRTDNSFFMICDLQGYNTR